MTKTEEIDCKTARVRKLIQKRNIYGILLKRQDNFSWITAGGLNVVTIADIEGVASIFITMNERYFVTNNIELSRMTEEENLVDLGFTPIEFNWFDENEFQAISKFCSTKNIGCDIADTNYQCMTNEIRELRYELLQPEIDRYLWLGEKASSAIETVLLEVTHPGMLESEIIGELSRILWKDRIDSVCFQAGADDRAYKYRHAIPTGKPVEKYIILNVNARKWGLITTITRSAHFGKPDGRLMKQYHDNTYIECGMIAATKPGTEVKEIFDTTRKLYQELGYKDEWRNHHQGGAQGYCNRDYLIKENSTEIVKNNQCFCWNPSIAGTKSEDAIIAKKNTPVFVTKPIHFPIIEIDFEGEKYQRPALLEV